MSLQDKILQRYKKVHPHQTLKEASVLTGIQITRIFRLFNGKKMKVDELETFERLIQAKIDQRPQLNRLKSLLEEISFQLDDSDITKIADVIERKISHKKFSFSISQINNDNRNIA
jgi:hypothetical protein